MAVNVLHFIETLGRGGAELLFVEYINALPEELNNVVVYMKPPHTVVSDLHNASAVYCLNYSGKRDILRCVYQLHKIIRKHKIGLIHSHLYWPTIIARLNTFFSRIPLIFHVHSLISEDAYKPNILSKYLEKLTYSRHHTAVFVSETVKNDYQQHIKTSNNVAVLHNFVRDVFYSEQACKLDTNKNSSLKLVTVGNLRPQKNQQFLLKCMNQLSQHNIKLDIYGSGEYGKDLEAYIVQHQIENVRLLGNRANLHDLLKGYDVFVMASAYEGFCIAMVEAMAVGLPCVLPDIEVLKEISGNTQFYYKRNNTKDFIDKINLLNSERELLEIFSKKAKTKANLYTQSEHIRQLTAFYTLALHGKNR